MYNLLIAEDSSEISEILSLYLTSAQHHIELAKNGLDALAIIKSKPIDLLITDIMMPVMDGYELIRQTRQISNMPILVLSAKTGDNDKIVGLNLGADDYISKPFNPIEIGARVNAALRRHYQLSGGAPVDERLSFDLISIDLKTFCVKKSDQSIDLTATEYKILLYLLSSVGRVYSKSQISSHLYGSYYETDDNSITVHISNIRKKLGLSSQLKPYISTVRGLGYRIEKI